MYIEQEIRKATRTYVGHLKPDTELDTLVLNSFAQYSQSRKRGKMLVRLAVSTGIACAVMGPTAAFTMPELADQVFGSFSKMKTKIAAATFEQYAAFGMKLSGAQKELGDDYPAFISLVKAITSAKVEYGDSTGNIDFSTLPKEKYDELRQVYYDIQPYFDRLNHLNSSREVLSEAEYGRYIDALIQHESILVKAEVDPSKGPVDASSLPEELQADYEKAKRILNDVKDRQER